MNKNLNPSQIRALQALMNNPQMRENLDEIPSCSNSPELIASLRRMGLEIFCKRVERFDRDGNACWAVLAHCPLPNK